MKKLLFVHSFLSRFIFVECNLPFKHRAAIQTPERTTSARLALTRRQDLALALAREMWNYQNLNLGFDIVDGVAGFHILRNRFPGQSFHKDLHPTT